MVEIRDLGFTFNGKRILSDVNIDINDGEILGIIGMGGSGKSILLRILSGLLKGYDGNIRISGLPMEGFSTGEFQKNISHLISTTPDNPDDTVYNFSLLSRIPHKSIFRPFSEYDLQIADDYMEMFGINGIRATQLGELSDSLLKKVQLAHTFIRESPLMILDNPSASLDLSSLKTLRNSIIKYTLNGDKSIIMGSSDINFILQISDRVVIMNDGKIAEEGLPLIVDADMVKKYFGVEVLISRNIYNGRPEVHLFPEG